MVPAWERWAMAGAVALLLVAGLASASVEGEQVETTIVAGPSAQTLNYATPVMALAPGGTLTFQNLDLITHDVVADEAGSDDAPWCSVYPEGKCPLFWSPLIGLGASTTVQGTDALPAGTYDFHCTLHPGMTGILVISPDGTVSASESWTPLPNPTWR